MTRRSLLACALVAVAATPLHARPVFRPVRVRMEGYFGSPIDGRPAETALVVGVGKKDRSLQVTKGRLPSGHGLAADVFAQVRAHKPNFIFRGRKALIAKIEAVPDGTPVTIDGQWMAGSYDYVVDVFEVEPAAR